jgi:hypothetical protein
LSSYKDSNGGVLFYQVKYLINNVETRLVSKTTRSSFVTTLPDADQILVEVYDTTGKVLQQQFNLDISDTALMSDIDFANYYNRIVIG